MHVCHTLTLDQLISLRDGDPVDAEVKLHVERCAACSKEITRLHSVRTALQDLPTLNAPAYNGAGMRARLQAVRTYRAAKIAAAAGVCTLTLVLILAVNGVGRRDRIAMDVQTPVADVALDLDADDLNVNSLVIRSQELEERLQRLPRRPQIERASTSATIDTLQSRIQWVDYQLSLSNDVGMTDSQSAELWANRIQLMDSLLMVRYAEAQRTAAVMTSLPRSSL